jgi:hypothetical protein
MALATAAQIRAATRINAANDTLLGVLASRADAAFARYCGHPRPDSGGYTMEAATYTTFPGRYDIGTGKDARVAVLPTPVIQSITSVHVDPEQDYPGSTLLAASEYVKDGRKVELTSDATHAWSTSPRANKVVVSAGYTIADHDVLTQACIIQVAHWLSNTASAGSSNMSTAGQSRPIAPLGLLPEVTTLLEPYMVGVP